MSVLYYVQIIVRLYIWEERRVLRRTYTLLQCVFLLFLSSNGEGERQFLHMSNLRTYCSNSAIIPQIKCTSRIFLETSSKVTSTRFSQYSIIHPTWTREATPDLTSPSETTPLFITAVLPTRHPPENSSTEWSVPGNRAAPRNETPTLLSSL